MRAGGRGPIAGRRWSTPVTCATCSSSSIVDSTRCSMRTIRCSPIGIRTRRPSPIAMAEQDPATVAGDLVTAGEALSASFAAVTPDQHERTGTRSDGARFTVETFGQYLFHDPVHHLWDVSQAAMKIRVGVCGAGGRMGSTACRAITADDFLELVAAVDPSAAGDRRRCHRRCRSRRVRRRRLRGGRRLHDGRGCPHNVPRCSARASMWSSAQPG